MKVVVTGAPGLTGGAIAGELIRRGHHVMGTVRPESHVAALAPSGAEAVSVDLSRPGSLASALRRADALVHVAGILFGESVAQAGLAHLSRVVVMSTAAVYSRSQRSRPLYVRNEDSLRGAAPDALFVRPTMIYGSPRDRNVHRVILFARRWRILPLPDGGGARIQPIHYADLAAATASLLETDATGVVDAGGPEAITLAAAARAIVDALAMPVLLVPVPVAAALPLARLMDRALGSRWAERLERTRDERVVDNARVLALTGASLRSFADGVRAEVAEMARR